MHLKYRQSCRICGNTHLAEVIDLGEQYLQGTFEKGDLPVSKRKIPNKLVRCDVSKNENACGLVQTSHTVPPSIMYSNYWYQSGISNTMRNHLSGIVDLAIDKFRLKDGKVVRNLFNVLDIAANDLSLLKNYPKEVKNKVAIDPCNITGKQKDENITIINDFYPSKELNEWKFDIITSIAMFYDLEEPNYFVSNIKKNLNKEGIWCFEMAYLPFILKNFCFDTFCSEHLEHYHLAPIEYLLKNNGLRVFDAYLNDINGGSIQVWATHSDNFSQDTTESKKRLEELRLKEFDLALDTATPYNAFRNKVSGIGADLHYLIRGLKEEGKTIHLYGASTKCNTLIQYAGLDSHHIPYAAERSVEKYGAKTVGTNIKIISEEESKAMKPDYYLVGPWHFKEEILKREIDTINKLGIKFIFPLPKIEIIDKV